MTKNYYYNTHYPKMHNCYYVYFDTNSVNYIDKTNNAFAESMKNKTVELYCAKKQLLLEECSSKIVGLMEDECGFSGTLYNNAISISTNSECAKGIATDYGWYINNSYVFCPKKAE